MFEFDETVDPDSVLVEEKQLDKARYFVEEDEVLGDLSLENQDIATEKIARMLTAVEIELLLQDNGRASLKSVDVSVLGVGEKTIVILGTKGQYGVACEACVMDTATADEILNY